MKALPKFDLVAALLALAGAVQARRNAKAHAKVRNLRAALQATTEALQAAELARSANVRTVVTRVV